MDQSKITDGDTKIIENILALHEVGGITDDLTHIDLAKSAGFNDAELKIVEMFWEPAFNKSWIYVSSELIHEFFGYAESKSSSSNFYKKLHENFDDPSEYTEVTSDHDIVVKYKMSYLERFPGKELIIGNRSKYFIINGETLKTIALMANTTKGRETRKYFIKVESLCSLMSQYMIERMKIDHKKAIEEKKQEAQKYYDSMNKSTEKHLDDKGEMVKTFGEIVFKLTGTRTS